MADRAAPAAEWSGAIVLALMAFATPLACAPPSIFQGFNTWTPAVLLVKETVIHAFAVALLALAAARAALGPVRIEPQALCAAALLGGYLLLSALSARFSPDPLHGFAAFRTEALAALAGATAVLFLRTPGRVRLVLWSALGSALVVGAIALVSSAGFPAINIFIYGADPLEAVARAREVGLGAVQGGAARAASLATLGNPEYTGNFLAGGLVLLGCWLLDGWGGGTERRPWAWAIGLAAAAALTAAIAATGTRGSWLVVAAGMVIRWVLGSPARGWMVAGALCAVMAAGMALGYHAGLAAFAVLAGALAVAEWRTGGLRSRFGGLPLRTRALLVASPVLAGLLLAAFSTPGPWNPRGLQLGQRFAEGLSVSDNSVRSRIMFFMAAGEMASRSPWLGVGPGFFMPSYTPVLLDLAEADDSGALDYLRTLHADWLPPHTHNDYFQIAAEKGLPAFALFLGWLVLLFRGLAHRFRAGGEWAAPAAAAAVGVGGYAAMMLASFPLGEGARLATFFVLAGAGMAVLGASPDPPGRIPLSRAGAGDAPSASSGTPKTAEKGRPPR